MYYTYYSYETDKGIDGKGYIGSRKLRTADTPEKEEYWGTPKSKRNLDFKLNKNKEKIILGEFETKEEAYAHEMYLHDLWDVDHNPHFANQAKQTSVNFSYDLSPTEDTRKKIGEAVKGEKNGMYGKTHTPEVKKKIKENSLKLKHTEETRKQMSKTHTGMKHTEETKRKISKANKGKKMPNDPWNKGKKLPPLSQEHKNKISESVKKTKNK